MKKKELILISTIIALITIIIILLIYYNQKEEVLSKEKTIEAELLAIGEDYLLVSTKEDIDYVIYTEDLTYKIGDKLKLELKNIHENSLPIEAIAKKITIIEEIKENNNEVEDDQEDKILEPKEDIDLNNMKTEEELNTNKKEEPPNNTQQENIQQKDESDKKYTEEDIINYFNNLDTELTNYNNDETKEKNIKEKFVKCIDFIFYGEEIEGKTFNELTNTAKLKVISIALSIDSKIDNKFPGYKDSIGNTYQNIKSKLVEKYLDITTNICNNDKELCINAKEGFKELKNSFGLTWDIIKQLAGKGTTKLKNWYEIWRYS